MNIVNASELELEFQTEAANLKNGITTILNSGPLACVAAFGGSVEDYEGRNGTNFLYKTLNRLTLKRWKALADSLQFSVNITEDNYQRFAKTYLNPESVKAFAKEEIEIAVKNALFEPKELVKQRLRYFLETIAVSKDFSCKSSLFTYKGYFGFDRTPKGYPDVKSFLVDVKNATNLNIDLANESKNLKSLDIIENPNVALFDNQIKVKGFKSGKVTIKIGPKIAQNLDRFLEI